MIVAGIDHHVGARLHVAGDAGRRRIDIGVMAVRSRRRISRAHGIAGRPPSPEKRSFELCGSWQSLQVTPAANILLCLNGV